MLIRYTINKIFFGLVYVVLLLAFLVFPCTSRAFTTASISNNFSGINGTVVTQQSYVKILDFLLPAPDSDSTIAGTAPSAGASITTTKDADWTTLYFYDAAAGADWTAANDIIFVNDGNVYYDDTKDTKLAGASTENALGAANGEATDWAALGYIDAADGGAWNAAADTIFEDNDGDNQYGPESTPADVVLAGTTPAATSTQTGEGVRDSDWTTVYTYDAADGGVWAAANDIIFVNDGNVYYDDTKDTRLAGATTENALGASNEPGDWTLFFYDKTDGGAWDSNNDWIGQDSDSSGYYQGDELTSIRVQNAGTAEGGCHLHLWEESGATDGFQYNQDTLVGSAFGFNSTISASSASLYTASSNNRRIYVSMHVCANATINFTYKARVPVNGIDLLYGTDGPTDSYFEGATITVVAPSIRRDYTAPTSSFTNLSDGEYISAGVDLIITGRSTDSGGSSVKVVKVSIDGGNTWYEATPLKTYDGGYTWQYLWKNPVEGNYTIKAFAADWIGNTEKIPSEVSVLVSAVEEIITPSPTPSEETVAEEKTESQEEISSVETAVPATEAIKESVPVSEKPVPGMTIEEIKTKIEEIQIKIFNLLRQLVELMKSKLSELY